MKDRTHSAWQQPIDDWVETYTGKKFRFMNPSPEDIDIVDIAHALSMTCRFGGHCKKFYSVAEHSIHVSVLVAGSAKIALSGLLHDAAEAYLSDICAPVKGFLPRYKEIESSLLGAILAKFGLPRKVSAEIKLVDRRMCITEGLQLLNNANDWGWDIAPYNFDLKLWSNRTAEKMFLDRFETLQLLLGLTGAP